MPKRSSIPGGGHGVTHKGPTLPRVSLDEAYRNPKPAAGERSGGPKKVSLKKP
jgi:hypothetical protein